MNEPSDTVHKHNVVGLSVECPSPRGGIHIECTRRYSIHESSWRGVTQSSTPDLQRTSNRMRSGEQHNHESSVGGGSLSRVTPSFGVHPTKMHTGEQHSLPMLRVLSRVLILMGTFTLNAPAGTVNNKEILWEAAQSSASGPHGHIQSNGLWTHTYRQG